MAEGPPIRVLHVLQPTFGWTLSSPDVDGMVGSGATYEDSRSRAEYLVRTHLLSRQGRPQPGRTAGTVRFALFADETAAGVRDEPVEFGPLVPPA